MLKEQGVHIFEGENYKDTLEKALTELNLVMDKVDIEIVEEKKSFMFKKGYVKIIVSPKGNEKNVSLELQADEEDITLEIDGSPFEEEMQNFKLNYRDDGVYLQVLDPGGANQGLEQDIIDFLKCKQVKDHDLVGITMASTDPSSQHKVAPAQKEVLVDSTLRVQFSKDKMEASIVISKPLGGKSFTLESLREALTNNNIVYGIDEEQLKRLVKLKWTDSYVTIARGKQPVDGVDGELIYHFDKEKDHKPVVLEDGSVDFKQLGLIKSVTTGTLLVEVVPPTEGTPGINVSGIEIPAKKGREQRFKKGKNTTESEDGLKLFAAMDGQVRFEDGKIIVTEAYEIPGNVDNSTGNINFNGTVIVHGNVKAGFSIIAEGNIEVNGVVEGATLISKGSIVLNRGIQGNNSAYLECHGNMAAKYIENATIKVQGDLTADFILHSEVSVKGKILLAGKKSLLVGGDVRAGVEIRAKIAGSHMGTLTKLEVGVDPEERNKFELLKGEVLGIQGNCQNLKKTIDLLKRQALAGQLPKNKEEMLIKSLKTYEFLQEKYQVQLHELQLLDQKIQNLSKGKVHVSHKIYPGVKVVISNAVKFFYDELVGATLYKKEGEITIGPYEQ
ncbi:FapA family protein [Alkaliphilus hydrothermalis]|uniref:Uncharacterized protein (DUF342 family) n=1 Tax=Alkaliphilus hydrothermalis TaxID=1482730 RepID=A0ABS2NLC6_9FIRM|nr:FapA family protein [Alkaliphilus hydrothermalis]MBM7613686.1 uncharacterized protein (DUF342 family) [Alkaliphilus hydrothermalis]